MSIKQKEVDHCGHCTLKGDLKKCLDAPCQIHDSWAFIELLQKTQQLEKELTYLKSWKRSIECSSTSVSRHYNDGLKKSIECVERARVEGVQDMRQVQFWIEKEVIPDPPEEAGE